MIGHNRTPAIAATIVAGLLCSDGATAQTLRIGLQEDPDKLDPTLSGTLVGRIVFAALCDKLVDIDPQMNIVPMLATRWEWSEDRKRLSLDLRDDVVFHDGTKFDAAAVKYTIERHRTLKGSLRLSELRSIDQIEVESPTRVTLVMDEPFVPLLATLADRAGMILSPTAASRAEANAQDFAAHPVCAGPFKFTERVAQDRIVLDRFDDYWEKSAIKLARIIYRPIPDHAVRLANLQSGDLDMIERLAAQDLPTVRGDANLRVEQIPSLSYTGLTINLANGARAENPLGRDPRVREALELAIDRDIINSVAFNGEYVVDNQPVPPASPFHAPDLPFPARNIEKARALLKEAGFERVSVELLSGNDTNTVRVCEIIQAMAAEAGFDLRLMPMEFAAAQDRAFAGDFELLYIGWSGRVDPDGNTYAMLADTGNFNFPKYHNPEVTKLLNLARTIGDTEERRRIYGQAFTNVLADRPIIYLHHIKWSYGVSATVNGFIAYPDGLIRPFGITKRE